MEGPACVSPKKHSYVANYWGWGMEYKAWPMGCEGGLWLFLGGQDKMLDASENIAFKINRQIQNPLETLDH